MSTHDHRDSPPPGDASGAAAPATYVGPAAPVPPRSRSREHLLGAAIGVVASLVALACLAGATALAAGADTRGQAVAVALAGGAALGAAALWSGRSAAAPTVAGAIWTVLGIIGLLPGRLLAGRPEIFSGVQTPNGSLDAMVDDVVYLGLVLVVGLVLLGLAAATSVARARGRAWERNEQAMREGGSVTTPPGHRLLSHIGAVVISAVSAVLGVVLVDELVGAILMRALPSSDPDVLLPLAIVVLASFAVGATGAMSSLGPATGALVWLTSAVTAATGGPLSMGLVSETVHPFLADLLGLPDPETTVAARGTAWIVSLVLAAGAIGIHQARRHGRQVQRREAGLIQSQNAAWSDSAV